LVTENQPSTFIGVNQGKLIINENLSFKKRIMKNLRNLITITALVFASAGGSLFARTANDTTNVTTEEDYKILYKANQTIRKSEMALENIMKDYENKIPPSLISQSEGIMIFPRALKIALGNAGGQGGRGIAMIRQENGTWSNPFIVSMGEASIGLQIGIQKSDIVLLFKNKNEILALDKADIMLGAGIGVVAGSVGKEAHSTNDFKFEADIYSYQHSKGLFAGASIKGGVLSCNDRYNATLYGIEDVETENIFNETDAPYNDHVSDLIATMDSYGE